MSLRQHDDLSCPVAVPRPPFYHPRFNACYLPLLRSSHIHFPLLTPAPFLSCTRHPPTLLSSEYRPTPATRLPTGTAHHLLPASIPTHPRCLVCTSFSASLPLPFPVSISFRLSVYLRSPPHVSLHYWNSVLLFYLSLFQCPLRSTHSRMSRCPFASTLRDPVSMHRAICDRSPLTLA